MFRIESLLSARLFLRPQRVGDRIFFESNMSCFNAITEFFKKYLNP